MIIVQRKAKQAQMMVTELSPPMSDENIQLNLKQTRVMDFYVFLYLLYCYKCL
jgi:hypothetical protein